MDMSTINGAIAGANSALTLLKTAMSTSNKVEINTAVAKMSESLLDARSAALAFQEAEFAFKQEIKDLKAKLDALENVSAEKED